MFWMSLFMRKPKRQGGSERELRIFCINLSTAFSSHLEFWPFPKIAAYGSQEASQPEIFVVTFQKGLQTLETYWLHRILNNQVIWFLNQKLSRSMKLEEESAKGIVASSKPALWCPEIKKDKSKFLCSRLAQFLIVRYMISVMKKLKYALHTRKIRHLYP